MITISIAVNQNTISYNYTNDVFFTDVTRNDILKYLKGIYTNKERFYHNFVKRLEVKGLEDLTSFLMANYDKTIPYTYKEAFNIKNTEYQSLVFGSINIGEMIDNLGCERVKVEGIPVKRKQFSPDGEFLGFKEYDNIYETYKVYGKGLGIDDDIFAVKCWCTSTNKEHWLWIEDQYKDSPLEAIASTFRVHKNLIPYIKELKRQGDILLMELTEDITPEGEIVPLNKEQYFEFLTSES